MSKVHNKYCSVAKLEQGNTFCEDAAMTWENRLAISDGAGGGGLFADLWAKYLVDHTPEKAIQTPERFIEWLDEIWEPFYLQCEDVAQAQGGMILNKFYEEGSFATYAAMWMLDEKTIHFVSYGDSVVFCYNYTTKELCHSFSSIEDFAVAPSLLNCKEQARKENVKIGRFFKDGKTAIFACTDALAHYILMTYKVSRGEHLSLAETNKNHNLLLMAQSKLFDFEKHILNPLFNALRDNKLHEHCRRLYKQQLLALDDYTLARLI